MQNLIIITIVISVIVAYLLFNGSQQINNQPEPVYTQQINNQPEPVYTQQNNTELMQNTIHPNVQRELNINLSAQREY
jgi:flagellar basal body-associated protein FliL